MDAANHIMLPGDVALRVGEVPEASSSPSKATLRRTPRAARPGRGRTYEADQRLGRSRGRACREAPRPPSPPLRGRYGRGCARGPWLSGSLPCPAPFLSGIRILTEKDGARGEPFLRAYPASISLPESLLGSHKTRQQQE